VRVSCENARENGVGDTVAPQRKDLTKLPLKAPRQYDLVCANLMHDLLISQAEKICARLKPSGRLILAGILAVQFPLVLKAYEKQGFRQVVTRVEKEWQSVELERVSQ
jgi:ribosomal protein L11 methyltransferase